MIILDASALHPELRAILELLRGVDGLGCPHCGAVGKLPKGARYASAILFHDAHEGCRSAAEEQAKTTAPVQP